MSILYVEVVVRSEHVGGDDSGVTAAMLLEIRPVPKGNAEKLLE